ncbi:MAG: prenyltransferase, partial [candidate division Zixibacteria bacterium]|nr:prenyltransferase [candidate division Zixibacteria bacterium]
GAVFVLWYTSYITKLGLGMAELAAGLGLGTMPVLGIFLIINGGFTWPALYASIPSGFLVCNLLLLNEFPDMEADKSGGRNTLPIQIGLKKAAVVYTIITLMVYIWIAAGVLLKLMPVWTLLALLTLPLAIKAVQGALTFKQVEELIPAQGANVMTVLITQLLLGIGFILARVVG